MLVYQRVIDLIYPHIFGNISREFHKIIMISWEISEGTWWLIPVSKWIITPVMWTLPLLNPVKSPGVFHLLTSRGMSHQVNIITLTSWFLTFRHRFGWSQARWNWTKASSWCNNLLLNNHPQNTLGNYWIFGMLLYIYTQCICLYIYIVLSYMIIRIYIYIYNMIVYIYNIIMIIIHNIHHHLWWSYISLGAVEPRVA